MKNLFLFFLLLSSFVQGQVKISDMPLYTGPGPIFAPVIVNGVNRKFDIGAVRDSNANKVIITTVAALSSLTNVPVNATITTTDIQGNWYVDPNDLTSPDNYGTIRVSGTQRIKRLYTGPLYVDWFGAKGDGVTDCSPAIEAALAVAGVGNPIQYGKGIYYHSRTIQLKNPNIILGYNGGKEGNNYATILRFADGIDGIVMNRYNTLGSSAVSNASGSADNAVIRGVRIEQVHTQKYASTIDFNQNVLYGFYAGSFSVGDSIKVLAAQLSGADLPNKAVAAISAVNNSTHNMSLTNSSNGFTVGENITGTPSGAIGKIVFVGGTSPYLAVQVTSGTFAANDSIKGGTSGFASSISSVGASSYAYYTLSGLTGSISRGDVVIKKTDYGSGIKMLARGTVSDCFVNNWANFGIILASGGAASTNTNCGAIKDVAVGYAQIHGIYAAGGDANANNIMSCSLNNCGGFGIYDNSFLGNYYFGNHVSYNYAGAFASIGYNNMSGFTNCYSEGLYTIPPYPIPGSHFNSKTVVTGGDHGAQIYKSDTSLSWVMLDRFSGVQGNYFSLGQSVRAHFDNTGVMDRSGLEISTSGDATQPNILMHKRGAGEIPASLSFAKTHVSEVTEAQLNQLAISSIGTIYTDYLSYPEMNFSFPSMNTAQSIVNLSYGNGKVVPVVSGGVVTSFIVTNVGSGYTTPPTISGTGNYAGLTGKTVVQNGSIVSATVTNSPTGLANTALTAAITMNAGTLYPATNSVSLGLPASRWSNFFGVNGNLSGTLNVTGNTTLSSLAGTGTRMVVADLNGVLSAQPITTPTLDAVLASGNTSTRPASFGNLTAPKLTSSQNVSSYTEFLHSNRAGSGDYPATTLLGYGNSTMANYALIIAAGNATGATQLPSVLEVSTNASNTQAASKQLVQYITTGYGQITTSTADNNNPVDLYLGGLLGNPAGIIKANNNILFGSTTDNGSKLQVNGNITALNPTATNHVATKAYSDSSNNTAVHLAGAETITGAKNFTVQPTSIAPTATNHLTTKIYVDSLGVNVDNVTIRDTTINGIKAIYATAPANSGGTVTSVSVASANGFTGSVATATTTPAISIGTSINGLLKGNGSGVALASGGADFAFPNLGYTGIVAAGTTQATATAVSGPNSVVQVTNVPAGTGIVLPGAQQYSRVVVSNRGANTLLVYPYSTHTINNLASSAPYSLPAGATQTFNGLSSLAWQTSTTFTGGDVNNTDGNAALTLPTINANVGTWNNVTVNGKGQVTAGSNVAYVTSVTGNAPLSFTAGATPVGSVDTLNRVSGLKTLYRATQDSSTLASAINSKQGSLTLTTTGTSGAATLTGSTLNIPNYATGGNGTVTSVATNNGTGVTGGTFTTTGTIANDTTNVVSTKAYRQKGLDSAVSLINTKQNTLSLSIAGTGAATLAGSTLTIPYDTTNRVSGLKTLYRASQDSAAISSNIKGIVKVLPDANYTVTVSDRTLILTTPAATRTLTLGPASAMPNQEINIQCRATTTGAWMLSGSFVSKSTTGTNPISETFVNSGLVSGVNYRLFSDGNKWYEQ